MIHSSKEITPLLEKLKHNGRDEALRVNLEERTIKEVAENDVWDVANRDS